MTIDIDKARKDYDSARTALNDIAHKFTVSKKLREEARERRKILSDDYLAKMIGNISERNQLYVDFIAELKAVIKTAGQDSPVEGVKRLSDIVNNAAQVVNSVRRDE